MASFDHITDEHVTNAIARDECTPSLVEEMQRFIEEVVVAIDEADDDVMDELVEQWRGDI